MELSARHRVSVALWLLLLWSVITALFAVQWHAYDSVHGEVHAWNQYVRWSAEQWYTWALLSPVVLWLAARFPITPRQLWRSLPLHVVAGAVLAVLAICIQALLSELLNREGRTVAYYIGLYLSKDVALHIATYWALTGFAQTLAYHRENGRRQLRETQLEKQLAETQLQVLQMQLHPHFLFNTLHAIGSLIHDDPGAAEKMLLDLSALLRAFLEGDAHQEITLLRELYLVHLYLGIQRTRFQDRLLVRSDIPKVTEACAVPSLLLQPLVENAIVHGIAKNPGADVIEIRSRIVAGALVLEITNQNSFLSAGHNGGNGSGFRLGLQATQRRLAQLYEGRAELSLEAREPLGVVCRVTLPVRLASAAGVTAQASNG